LLVFYKCIANVVGKPHKRDESKMFPPTTKQRNLERVIERLTAANDGVVPSFKELAAELGITYAAARGLSNRLCARGRARHQYGVPRTLELIKEGRSSG
jgi:rubrerythrin